MPRKPTQPALYELIRHKPRSAPPTYGAGAGTGAGAASGGVSGGGPGVSAAPARALPVASFGVGSQASGVGSPPIGSPPSISASSAPSTSSAGPGRFVRVPVGYAYVGIGVALAALVFAYIYGFSSGEKAAAARFEERRIEELDAQGNLPAVDPLKAGQTPESLRQDGRMGENRGSGDDAGGDFGGDEGGTDLGPAPGNDPRQPGLNYFIVASNLSTLNGEPMVRFCRKNGLDAHLVPDDNGKLRILIVCPGFAGGERRDPSVTALQEKIKAVGRKWKSAGNGRRDFGDLYPKLHKPSS
jgi:hypothetical protein